MSRLLRQLQEAVQALRQCEPQPALIGGLAVIVHKVIRTTTDVDLLVASKDSDRVHEAVAALGYQCTYRNENVANYDRADERLDVIYSHPDRPSAVLLRNAEVHDLPLVGPVRVISPEGLIGFKVGGYLGSDRKRAKDLDDILELLRLHRGSLKMDEVKRYFGLFEEGPALLQEIVGRLSFVESDLDE